MLVTGVRLRSWIQQPYQDRAEKAPTGSASTNVAAEVGAIPAQVFDRLLASEAAGLAKPEGEGCRADELSASSSFEGRFLHGSG